MSEEGGAYVLSAEKVLLLVIELKEDESLGASLLQHYIEMTGNDSWEDTPIPPLCEYYTGCRHIRQMLMDMMTTPVEDRALSGVGPKPKNLDDPSAKSGFVMTEGEYVILNTLLSSLKALKSMLRVRHNISFEVH